MYPIFFVLSPIRNTPGNSLSDRVINIWIIRKNFTIAQIVFFSTEDSFQSAIKCVSFIDHKSVVTGNALGNLKVWDLSSGQPKSVFSLPSTLKLVSILSIFSSGKLILVS